MATMIEKMARAIRREMGDYPAQDSQWMGEGGLRGVAYYADVARAALEALLEPSMAMMDAGTPVMTDPMRSASVVFRIMIQVALEEK